MLSPQLYRIKKKKKKLYSYIFTFEKIMTTIIINSNQLMKPTTKRYKALNIIHIKQFLKIWTAYF
jgi:hypothetical protein